MLQIQSASSDYLHHHALKDKAIIEENTVSIFQWNGKKLNIGVVQDKSEILLNLVNELFSKSQDAMARALLLAFVTTSAANKLAAIEANTPRIAFGLIESEIATRIESYLLDYENTAALSSTVSAAVGAVYDRMSIKESETTTAAVEETKDVETKSASSGVNRRGAEFVVNAEMFPTRPGTADYKRRVEEGRKYFGTSKHLDAAVDFITSRVKFPYTFVLKHVNAEELAKAYASCPEDMKPNNAPFGLLHRLSVLFLNTMEPENEGVANAAMNYVMRASWERAAVENNTQQTEQQEILARMNLSRAGELVK